MISQLMLSCMKMSLSASRVHTITRIFCKIAYPLTITCDALLIKVIIDQLQKPSVTIRKLLWLVALICALKVSSMVILRLNSYSQSVHGAKIERLIMTQMIGFACTADLQLYDSSEDYDNFTKSSRDVQTLNQVVWSMMDIIGSGISLVSIFAIMAEYSFLLALLFVIGAIPAAVVEHRFVKKAYYLDVDQINNIRKKEYISFVATFKEFAMSVRLYRLKEFLLGKYDKYWGEQFFEKRKIQKKQFILQVLGQLTPIAVFGGAAFYLAKSVLNGKIPISDFVLYTSVSSQIMSGVACLISAIMIIYDSRLKIEGISRLEKISHRIEEQGIQTLSKISKIEFKNVSFSYPFSYKLALDRVSFTINAGEIVYLVGANGSGKSTIIKLLLRFYEPTSGEIRVNDLPIKEYNTKSLRDSFSTYFQNEENFHFTIKENIAISDIYNKVDYGRMQNLLKNLDALDVLANTPKGMNSFIGKSSDQYGIELSDGQSQKLALARCFYKNAEVYILDEPSSSLDPESEENLFSKIKLLCSGETVIIVSHRLVSIESSAHILVLEKGVLIEDGSKFELLQRESRFRELYKCQLNKYDLGDVN